MSDVKKNDDPNIRPCPKCTGTGWFGHGMGGDTCAECNGTGMIGKKIYRGGCPHCGYSHPPDGICLAD